MSFEELVDFRKKTDSLPTESWRMYKQQDEHTKSSNAQNVLIQLF